MPQGWAARSKRRRGHTWQYVKGPGQNYLVNTEGVPEWLQQGAILGNSGTIANNSNAAAAAQEQPNVEIIVTIQLTRKAEGREGDLERRE